MATAGMSTRPTIGVWPVVLPSVHDPRLHAAAVVMTIHVLGQTTLGFAVSVPQIVAAILGAALVEVAIGATRHGVLAWPASAMLTGSGVALIMRVDGTVAGDHWTFHRWWWFALVAIGSLATKYLIRWRGGHLFNPSNVGLVIVFVVLGSSRVEPLPFHWSEPSLGLAVAYAVIIVGGTLITRRLGLLQMALTFWLVFGAGLAVVAASGHCMSAPWTPRPVCDGQFWWTVVASPEVCVFLFFMLTDPRTVPTTARSRVGFAIVVAAVATLLIAPQQTEFGAKVALLAALTIACASRPALAWAQPRWARLSRGTTHALSSDERGVLAGGMVVAGVVLFLVATVTVGAHAREADAIIPGEALPMMPAIDWHAPEFVPDVTLGAGVTELDPAMASSGARRDLLRAVLLDLAVERELLERGDGEALAAVDHGARLAELRSALSNSPTASDSADDQWPTYTVSQGELVVRRAGRQATAVLALGVTGTEALGGTASPWSASIAVRRASDGRWLIVEVKPR